MQKTMYLLAALLLTALAAAACAGGQEVPPPASVPAVDVEPVATAPPTQQPVEQTAVLEIRATDAPPEGVTKILITAGQIQVQQSGEDDESGWHTVVPGPVEFDLVAITGVEEVLGSRELAPGRYGQVRLDIQSVEVTMEDGAVLQARVPSRRLRVVGGFTLEAGQATVLTLDFDADKSVVIAGPRNVLLKPAGQGTRTRRWLRLERRAVQPSPSLTPRPSRKLRQRGRPPSLTPPIGLRELRRPGRQRLRHDRQRPQPHQLLRGRLPWRSGPPTLHPRALPRS